ncbi:MAG: hypothetical protein Q4F95_15315, partial [Oscillospiraceae bacterium]|nr:hypothetical protein [Oscillospiraceae bacterium]
MKNTKKIIIPLLAVAGVMAARISVSADTTFCNNDTVSHLKKCLLLNEYNRYVQENNYNYWNYDINKNNKVDVFDVCRMKAAMLDQSNQTTTTPESTTTVTTTTTPEP